MFNRICAYPESKTTIKPKELSLFMKPRQIHFDINKEIIRLADKGSLIPLIEYCSAKNKDFNITNITTALHRLARLFDQSKQHYRFFEELAGTKYALKLNFHGELRLFRENMEQPIRVIEHIGLLKNFKEDFSAQEMKVYELLYQKAKTAQDIRNRLDKVVALISRDFQYLVRSCKSGELANSIWAFCALEYEPLDVFYAVQEELARRAPDNFRGFTTFDFAFIMVTFAEKQFKDEQLMLQLAEQACLGIASGELSYKKEDIIFFAKALATLQVKHVGLLNFIAREAVRYPDILVSVFWNLIMLNFIDLNFMRSLYANIEQINGLNSVDLMQIHHADLILQQEYPEEKLQLPQKITERIRGLLEQQRHEKPYTSNMHREVSALLSKMRLPHVDEYFVEGYYLDCAFPEMKVALEIDNELFHNMSNSEEQLGKDVLRDRILKNLGWHIVHVLDSAWKGSVDKQDLLKQILPGGMKLFIYRIRHLPEILHAFFSH